MESLSMLSNAIQHISDLSQRLRVPISFVNDFCFDINTTASMNSYRFLGIYR